MIELFGYPEAKAERAKLLAASGGAGGAEGWACERDMLHCALHWANVPVDVIPEESVEGGALEGRYRVLYVYEPNLSAAAQARAAAWVRAGGVLYLGPQAATRDEGNGPLDLLAALTGNPDATRVVDYEPKGTFEQKGLYGETWRMAANYTQKHVDQLRILDTVTVASGGAFPALGWKEVLPRELGETVATYADRAPAVCVVPVGEGFVVKSGTCLGAAYARTSQPSLGHAEWSNPPPVPGWRPQAQTWQRRFDPVLQDLILRPVRTGGVEPAVRLGERGVDAGLFEMPDGSGAVLLLGSYTTADTSALPVQVGWRHRYTRALVESSGQALPVAADGPTTRVTVPLKTAEVVEFLP